MTAPNQMASAFAHLDPTESLTAGITDEMLAQLDWFEGLDRISQDEEDESEDNDGVFLGSMQSHGALGTEVVGADGISLGLFPDYEAARAALPGWGWKGNGGGNPAGSPEVSSAESASPSPQTEPARTGNGQLTHDKAMASTFLSGLDPTATRFTFQTFDDNKDRKSKALARVLHGTLDECFAKLTHLNNLGAGIFVTISETNFLGRSTKNIVRVRALFYDADGDEQVEHSEMVIKECDAPPSITVNSGGGRHGYYICDDIPLEQFTTLQKSLIAKLGTDPNPKDLPRVMRLPGFLHCKDPSKPRLVKLIATEGAVRKWKLSDLMDKLGLSTTTPDRTNGKGADDGVEEPPRPAEAFRHLDPNESLADGIVINDVPSLPFAPIKAECAWIREAHDTGGKDFDQWQWKLTTLVATSLENGHELAHEFGNKHPGYTPESTDEMWERNVREQKDKDLGWPYCKTIHDAGSKHCKSCQHFPKGKSPLNLAPRQAPLPQPGKKLLLIVELGSKLWGAPTAVNGKEYRFGADQSKVIDPGKGAWFDFVTNRGGHLRELMKKVAAAANREQPNADDVVVVRAEDVVMRPLDWVWKGHLLRGSQELMSGLPDLSKSTVQINYIACATARLPWPDGAPAIDPMNVIMLTAEDTLDQIVVPRLRAAGADVSRVKFLKCIKTDEHDRQFLLAEDLDRLESLVRKLGNVGLITIDPITAYMGGKMDSYKATEVRAQLGPFKDFSERMNIALSTITHPPKSAGHRALDHFIASQAFIAACRVGHLCIAEMEEKDGVYTPTGRILFTNVRNTAYRQLMPTLAYHKEEVIVGTVEQGFERPVTAPKIVWEGPVDITADAAVAAASGKKSDQQPKAQAFLREMLKDGKPVPQKEIEEAATAKGFTDKQLRTAREKLGVHVNKEPGKMDGGWLWQLPDPSDGKYYY